MKQFNSRETFSQEISLSHIKEISALNNFDLSRRKNSLDSIYNLCLIWVHRQNQNNGWVTAMINRTKDTNKDSFLYTITHQYVITRPNTNC
jgi:hypothetical protein